MDVTWRTADRLARLAPASGGLDGWLGPITEAEEAVMGRQHLALVRAHARRTQFPGDLHSPQKL